MKFFNTDGTEFTKKGVVAPIGFVSQKEYVKNKDPDALKPGWYFQDEAEQSNGPYDTLESVVKEQEIYCREVLNQTGKTIKEIKKELGLKQKPISKKIIDIENPTDADVKLGTEVEDKIGGHKGIVTVITENLYRVPQYAVQPRNNSMLLEAKAYQFDAVALRVINKEPLFEVKLSKPVIKMGIKAKCTVTNFEGVVTAREFHINGCIRIRLTSKFIPGDETSMSNITADESGVSEIKEKKVEPVAKKEKKVTPNKGTPGRGCAATEYVKDF